MAVESEELNLQEAWRRVKRESQTRQYLAEPFEIPLVEVDSTKWLDALRARISAGYNPGAAGVLELPKGAGAVRPIARLRLDDRVLYTALVGASLQQISPAVAWAARTVDYSHPLNDDGSGGWLRAPVQGWGAFREESLSRLDAGAQWVIVTDVTAFYENVDLKTLMSDLSAIGVSLPVQQLLSKLLNRWAAVTGRGLPQGAQASDVLSKLYLNPVDLSLRNLGVDHLRYSDDIRIFCASRTEALTVLRDLARLLRGRGLHLQTAKSRVMRADDARVLFEGVVPALRAIRQRFLKDVAELFDLGDPYLSVAEVDELLNDNPNDAPVAVLREAFDSYIGEADGDRLDKTLLHFLVNRLGAASDPHVLPQVRRLLVSHPEETQILLHYIDRVDAFAEMEPVILGHTASREGQVYDWQTWEILNWLDSRPLARDSAAFRYARERAFAASSPPLVRAVARRIVGRYGNVADLQALEAAYGTAANDLERAQILCSLKRMEVSRRNSFLARAAGDGDLPDRAVRLVRAARPD